MRIAVISVLVFVCCAAALAAQPMTGNRMLEGCVNAGQIGEGFCLGYVVGVVDGMVLGAFEGIIAAPDMS